MIKIKRSFSLSLIIASAMFLAACGGSSSNDLLGGLELTDGGTTTDADGTTDDSDTTADAGGTTDNDDTTTDAGGTTDDGGFAAPTRVLVTEHIAPPDIIGNNYIALNSNAALLSGALLGTGDVENSLLIRDIPFERSSLPDPALELLKVTMVEVPRNRFFQVLTVRNYSSELVCGISMTFNYFFTDLGVRSSDTSFRFSSDMADFIHTEDGDFSLRLRCLAAGSIGYYVGAVRDDLDISLDSDNLTHIIFGRFLYSDGFSVLEQVPTRSRLVPISYSLDTRESNGDTIVKMLVRNEGTVPIFAGGCVGILLDDDAYPLSIMFPLLALINPDAPGQTREDTRLEPGDTFEYWFDVDSISNGQSSTMRAHCSALVDE